MTLKHLNTNVMTRWIWNSIDLYRKWQYTKNKQSYTMVWYSIY